MHPDFNPPSIARITGRTSSITGAFFAAITPVVSPTDEEVDEALSVLGMSKGNCTCAYCGRVKSEWDHFRAIVKDRKPTGYITEIANLVPACGKCNQSKGNTHWEDWMRGPARHSPKQRGVVDLEQRIARLRSFESWRQPTRIDYATLISPDRWAQYHSLLEEAISHLSRAQDLAEKLQVIIQQSIRIAAPEEVKDE